MDHKGQQLEFILQKEGASEALQQLSNHFNISDTKHIEKNWTEVEEFLMNFRLKRYRISQDYLFSEIVLHPFKDGNDIQELKNYLLN